MKITKTRLKQIIKEELAAMEAGEEGMPAPADDAFTARAREKVKMAYVDDEGRVISKNTGTPLRGMHLRNWIYALAATQGADLKGSIGQRSGEGDMPTSLSYAQEEEDPWSKAAARDRKASPAGALEEKAD